MCSTMISVLAALHLAVDEPYSVLVGLFDLGQADPVSDSWLLLVAHLDVLVQDAYLCVAHQIKIQYLVALVLFE